MLRKFVQELLWTLACAAAGAVLVLGAVGDFPPSAAKIAIHDEVDFKASPERVYEALVDEEEFSAFSGTAGHIQREAGGAFRLFGGRVTGRNLELTLNQRIVQAWRSESWPPGVYSIVRFELLERPWGTRLVFDQQGIPRGSQKAQVAEWPRFYWDPMRKYLDL